MIEDGTEKCEKLIKSKPEFIWTKKKWKMKWHKMENETKIKLEHFEKWNS